MSKQNGDNAFPTLNHDKQHGRLGDIPDFGVPLRDWYAGNAPEVPGYFMKRTPTLEDTPESLAADALNRLVAWRWAYADAMITARLL